MYYDLITVFIKYDQQLINQSKLVVPQSVIEIIKTNDIDTSLSTYNRKKCMDRFYFFWVIIWLNLSCVCFGSGNPVKTLVVIWCMISEVMTMFWSFFLTKRWFFTVQCVYFWFGFSFMCSVGLWDV